jgi:phage tail sheath protein FI
MPVTPTYPGVYIEEVPSGVHTIVGVATGVTAFLGRAQRGPLNDPITIQSFADFDRRFGGLWQPSTMSYAVQQYFLNGGGEALVVRLDNGATLSTASLSAGADTLDLVSADAGSWGGNLRVSVDHDTESGDPDHFNLVVEETRPLPPPADPAVVATETHRNLSTDSTHPRFVERVLRDSTLIRVDGTVPATRPDEQGPVTFLAGSDGQALDAAAYQGNQGQKTGLYALEKADIFNLLAIPPPEHGGDTDPAVWSEALTYCKLRRAMLLVDPPASWNTVEEPRDDFDDLGLTRDENAALYFPRVRFADPLAENRLAEFVPSAAVAGAMARTDVARGVWKAPAGQDVNLRGVRELTVSLTDGEQGQLNPLGINVIRSLPVVGTVIWGARTLRGADRLASEWKYVPVRRLALFLEESLYRGTQWAVFEPNDEPLWSQIRLNLGAFMHSLFRQGAFQGASPRDAYFVKCDKETTTQNDIDRGIVNIVVGFAPLKPAEFVIIKIEQIAGQIQT